MAVMGKGFARTGKFDAFWLLSIISLGVGVGIGTRALSATLWSSLGRVVERGLVVPRRRRHRYLTVLWGYLR